MPVPTPTPPQPFTPPHPNPTHPGGPLHHPMLMAYACHVLCRTSCPCSAPTKSQGLLASNTAHPQSPLGSPPLPPCRLLFCVRNIIPRPHAPACNRAWPHWPAAEHESVQGFITQLWPLPTPKLPACCFSECRTSHPCSTSFSTHWSQALHPSS